MPTAPRARPSRESGGSSIAGEQVHIVLGHLGIARHHPDFEALVVLDHIFGTGPDSPTGWAGSSATSWAWSTASAAASPTRPTSCRACSASMPARCPTRPTAWSRRSPTRSGPCTTGAFSDDEVDRARRYLAGAWVFDFQTVEQRAERLLELERLGLGLDEPRHWPERIAAITPRQVRQAARGPLAPAVPLPRRVRSDPPSQTSASAECARGKRGYVGTGAAFDDLAPLR